MKIELVVFDMAGTTVRDDDAVNDCLREALAAAGVKVTKAQVNEVMGIAKPRAIRALLDKAGKEPNASADRVTEIHADFMRRMIAHYENSTTVEPMPHTLETFTKLRAAGVRVALDTGFNRRIVDTILTRLGWTDGNAVDATVATDEVLRGRPHPDMVVKAMNLTGVRYPQAVAKVGDTPADLQEGNAAGCAMVIGVTNGSHTTGQLRVHPHTHLVSSLAALPELILNNA